MGKTFTREERKNNKYSRRDDARRRKMEDLIPQSHESPRPKPKKKWRPHSEIDAD